MDLVGQCSEDNNMNEEAAKRGADLLAAAMEGRDHELVQVLEADPELIRVGDPVGDTALHVVVRGGHIEALRQLLEFLQDRHPELLTAVTTQGNGHGDIPLHLAIKNKHREAASLLHKVDPMTQWIDNDDGMSPSDLAAETGDDDVFNDDEDWLQDVLNVKQTQEISDKDKKLEKSGDGESPSPQNEDKQVCRYKQLLESMSKSNPRALWKRSALADINMQVATRGMSFEGEMILQMVEADLNLVQYKNKTGNTILHEAASSGNMDMLTKLVGQITLNTSTNSHGICADNVQLPLPALLEQNNQGNTALHLALLKEHKTLARYLIEVEPEAAYKVNNEGISPLYLALTNRQDDLVKYVLKAVPETSISPAIRQTLLNTKKGSLPHAAIRARNLMMLEALLESLPSLIDSSDEKGWKPLPYAAYKGYLEEVQYLLKKFPESVNKFDSDGTLPIHKAVSGGHISIFKEFISCHPQTIYHIDKKGRSILHIAVRYAKADILAYLIQEISAVQKILNLKDHDGNTFKDLAKKLKSSG